MCLRWLRFLSKPSLQAEMALLCILTVVFNFTVLISSTKDRSIKTKQNKHSLAKLPLVRQLRWILPYWTHFSLSLYNWWSLHSRFVARSLFQKGSQSFMPSSPLRSLDAQNLSNFGCSKPHPIWAWTVPGMGHQQLLWPICSSVLLPLSQRMLSLCPI